MPTLSVIIPTHKRADILAECLHCLERQTIAGQIEVIVVNDGPDEKTAFQMENGKWKMENYYFEIPKSQQGSARNEGLKHAHGKYVLFIGDDIFLEPEACERHLNVHEQWKKKNGKIFNSPLVVLGFITWDPSVGITPVMRWLEESGWQFGYPSIASYAHDVLPQHIQHQFSYTSHISLPLETAKKHLFRSDIHLYGWEDIEWGMRIADTGVRLFYEPDAKAFHHHPINLEESLQRMEVLGRSAVEISKKIPAFDRVPKGWKLFLYQIASLLPTMAGRHRKAFLSGLQGTMYDA